MKLPLVTPIYKDTVYTWTYSSGLVNQTGMIYIDNLEYQITSGMLQSLYLLRMHNPEGYADNVTMNPYGPFYYYYHKDHLGNNREVWKAAFSINGTVTPAAVVQQTSYYPSGLPWSDGSGVSSQPYKYNGKEFVEMHGLDTYDYGARGYYPAMGRFMSVDPLAEKHYNISPYVYCANNPVNLIDPDGMDWYKDKDGTNQYNPDLNKDNQKDILGKDQSYVGETYQVKDDDGNVTTDYRKDGSIIYTDETDAYNRMWSQAHDHYKNQKEVGGATLKNGDVLVLPDYKNDNSTTKYDEYGYSIGKGKITDSEGNTFKITGFVHTHQDPKAGDATPSYYTGDGYGDLGVSRQMGGLPIMTIGYDGYIHAAFDANVNGRITNAAIDMNGLTRRSLLNGTNLTPWLNTYPTRKKR